MTRPYYRGREWPIVWEHLDPECIPLVRALNALPGIRTQECCCGHGEGPFWICLEAERAECLWTIVQAIEQETYYQRWHLQVESGPPRRNALYYRLQGPAGCYGEAAALANILGGNN